MKLFISFNLLDLNKALTIAHEVNNYCDAFEIGPVLLAQYGAQGIQKFRAEFPHKIIMADTNIAEFEKEYVEIAARSGADWVTVLAGASNNTIHNTCSAAHSAGKKVMLDLIDTLSAGQSAVDAQAFGLDALIVHNTETNNPFMLIDRWDLVRGNTKLPIFICNYVDRNNIGQLIKLDPAGIIIGRAITHAADPRHEANHFYNIIKNVQ